MFTIPPFAYVVAICPAKSIVTFLFSGISTEFEISKSAINSIVVVSVAFSATDSIAEDKLVYVLSPIFATTTSSMLCNIATSFSSSFVVTTISLFSSISFTPPYITDFPVNIPS